jgi:hypothetical protein
MKAEYDLHKLLRLHKIVKELGMEEHDIINVRANENRGLTFISLFFVVTSTKKQKFLYLQHLIGL